MLWRTIKTWLSPLAAVGMVFLAACIVAPGTLDFFYGPTNAMICDEPVYDFGTAKHLDLGVARFTITNVSDNPVKILGSTCVSGCFAVDGIPVVVPAHDACDLTARVSLTASAPGTSPFTQAVKLLFDTQTKPVILTVKANVVR
jgi:hypothetical protein